MRRRPSIIFADDLLLATFETAASSSASALAPAYVQSKKNSVTNSVTLDNPVTSGNLIVVGLTVYNAAIPTNAISDNKGNTYTKVAEAINGSDHAAIFYAKNVTGGSSFTITSSVNGTVAAHEYSGLATSTVFDKTATSTGSSATPTTGNVTTSTSSELYFGLAWSKNDSDAWSAGAGYTLREQETNNNTAERIATEDAILLTASTTFARFTTTTSNPWAAAIATFLPQTTSSSSTGTITTLRFMHPDHLGSLGVVTNASGTVVQVLDYYPFGSTRINTTSNGFSGEKRQFASMERDASTNFDYAQNRFYANTRGQFISDDPAFLAVGDPAKLKSLLGQNQQTFLSNPQQLNSYSWAQDNPINKSDPTGLGDPLSAYFNSYYPNYPASVVQQINQIKYQGLITGFGTPLAAMLGGDILSSAVVAPELAPVAGAAYQGTEI